MRSCEPPTAHHTTERSGIEERPGSYLPRRMMSIYYDTPRAG